MDTIIENVYVDNEALLKEVTTVALKRKMLTCIGAMVATAAAFAVLGVVLENPSFYLGSLICLAMGYFFTRMPRQAATSNYESKLDLYEEQIPPTTVRFGERITVAFNETEVDFIYEEIHQVKILKTCIIFEGPDRTWYYTPFDTFTQGSAGELLALLKERCPHLNIPTGPF